MSRNFLNRNPVAPGNFWAAGVWGGMVLCSCIMVISAQSTWAEDSAPAEVDATETAATETVSGEKLTFEDDIVPLLEARCFKCHGAEVRKGGLDLRRRFKLMEGGDNGPAIEPGKPDESLLLELIHEGTMPPKEEGRLDEKQISLLTRWISSGAPIVGTEEKPLEESDVDASVTAEDRAFWAFQPPTRPAVPEVQHPDRVRTPIDAFLLAKLEEKGLSFNPDASPRVLLRRLCFDLLGLPPTPEQEAEFLADDQPGAYERLVDRLLASEHYGERWGRHWLDVAGYADSDGYLEADRERPEAWRYRDYVINALNKDTPYDRFLIEQLAGDELYDWRQAAELTSEMEEALIATGFLRTASDPTYANYKDKPECYKVMADTTHIISSALLGVTLQCARCHAHKADPFSHRDYYQLHAIFLPSYDPDRWVVSLARDLPLATEVQIAKINEHNSLLDQRVKYLNDELAAWTTKHQDKLLAEKLPDLAIELRNQVKAALLVEEAKRNDEQKKLVADHATGISLAEADLEKAFPEFKSEADKLKAAIAAEQSLRRSYVKSRGLMDIYPEPRQAHVLRRGDHNNLGQEVQPDVPTVLAPVSFKLQPEPGYKTTGRRLAFAKWLVNPDHPLTARVHVNRVWAHHLGRGIVDTIDDFGHNGSRPTHPELLDWLAREFIELGWSQKALHRLILTSSVYRQTSDQDTAHAMADPDNILLGSWQPQRHEGEVIRDSVLALAGKLNLQMHGVPVPVSRTGDGQVITGDDPQGNRRSVYLKVRRSQPVTLLELFDTPRMEINCARRTEAIVATQALTMLNSKFMATSAVSVRDRILKTAGEEEGRRIEVAYDLLFARSPSATERQAIEEFLASVTQEQLGDKAETATVAERQAARHIAWEHACLTLLNSNEFLYVH